MIFLDNASTTALCSRAVDYLVEYSCNKFYNPSASYSVGFENHKKIDETKQLLAKHLGVKFQNNIVFTGSATEATNLAIFGSYKPSWKKAIFSAGEHPSVYNSALALQDMGVEVVFVDLQKENGQIDYEKFANECDENVNFISVMQVSNETGAINDIEKIFQIKQQKCPNAILHCDGVQAFGKIETNLTKMGVDFFTISAHKFHGPKGLGALWVKNIAKLRPIIYGGGQEYNIRSGTENLPAIMALYGALEEVNVNQNFKKVSELNKTFKKTFLSNILPEIPTKIFDENMGNFSPYVMSISIKGIKGEVLQNLCDQNGLLISTGSACSSKKAGNRILENLGYSKEEVIGNIRVSFASTTTLKEAVEGAKILASSVNQLWRNTR